MAGRYHLEAQRAKGHSTSPHPSRQWTSPPPGTLKFNTDAAFDGEFSISRILVRNSSSMIVHSFTAKSLAFSAFEAEALAVLKALELAAELRVTHAIFEGDAADVVLAINGANFCLDWSGRPHIVTAPPFGFVR